MIRHIKTWAILFILPVSLSAQIKVDSVLSAIEKNNTSLSAMRKSTEAEKFKNQTGIYLQNPEVEFDYLWNNNTEIGNRTDFSIKQSFDFPTAYNYRHKIADSRNLQSDLEYQQQRMGIMYSARMLCADIMYANAVNEEYGKRLMHAQSLANAFQVMYEKGEVSILEHNKAQLNLLNLKKEAEARNIERTAYIQQLAALNGGIEINFIEKLYQAGLLPSDFNQWYSNAEKNNPALLWLKQEIEVNQQQEKLNRAMGLPKASAGYMSEKVVGEHFQGISVGVSIPLWENKNTVKYAQAQTLALQSIEVDRKLQFYNQLKIQYEKAASLQQIVNEYRQALQYSNNTELLKKALDQGELSLINYLMELSFTYLAMDNLLKSEYELNKALSLLAQFDN
jgi:outer membrane protein TolC